MYMSIIINFVSLLRFSCYELDIIQMMFYATLAKFILIITFLTFKTSMFQF